MSDITHSVIGDIRFAARQLRRNLPLTIAALLCFALGVGANTSIFSVVNAVLFRPLPFPDADELVMVSEGIPKLAADIGSISAADLLDYKEAEGRVFESLALARRSDATIMVNGEADVIPGASVTPSAFKVLRVTPAVGRAFLDSDTTTSAPLVVVISDGLWRRRYGADRSMVGRQITFSNGQTAEVVGIMPPDSPSRCPALECRWPTSSSRSRSRRACWPSAPITSARLPSDVSRTACPWRAPRRRSLRLCVSCRSDIPRAGANRRSGVVLQSST